MSTAEIDEELRAYADLRGRMRAHAIDMIVRDALTTPLGHAARCEAEYYCDATLLSRRRANTNLQIGFNLLMFTDLCSARYRALFESRPAPS